MLINVLLQLEPTNSVDKFSIKLEDCNNRLQIENWISAAVKLNVRYLSLNAFAFSIYENPIDLPGQVFDCKSLETWMLSSGVIVNIPKQGFTCFRNLKFLSLTSVSICGIPAEGNSACFPKLETLHLRNVGFVGKDESVMMLIHSCPVLKDLLMNRYVENNVSNICIPVLTSIELTFGLKCKETKVEIEAPIKHLSIVAFKPAHKVFIKNPGSLITADVRMSNIKTKYYEAGRRVFYDFKGEQKDDVTNFMKMLEKVTRLYLGCHTITIIRASQIELPMFFNLTRLQVQMDCKKLCVLQCLFNNSNKLQTLVIEKIGPSCRMEDEPWMEFSHVPKCLLTSLKWVEFQNFDGCTHWLDMMKNLLKFAEILKRLTIKYRLQIYV